MHLLKTFFLFILFISLTHKGLSGNLDRPDSSQHTSLISITSSYNQFHIKEKYSVDVDYKGYAKNIGIGLSSFNRSKTFLYNTSIYLYEERNYLKLYIIPNKLTPTISYKLKGFGFNFNIQYYPKFLSLKNKNKVISRFGIGSTVSLENNPFFFGYQLDNKDTTLNSYYTNYTLTKPPVIKKINLSVNYGCNVNVLFPISWSDRQLYILLQYGYGTELYGVYFHNPIDFAYKKYMQSYTFNLLYTIK